MKGNTTMSIRAFTAAVAALSLAAILPSTSEARPPRPVLDGAMQICQIIDGGETITIDGVETCCATEIIEFDDGLELYGRQYCVSCVEGTDNCVEYDQSRQVLADPRSIPQVTQSISIR